MPTVPKVQVTKELHKELKLEAVKQELSMKALMQRVWDEWKQGQSNKGDES